MNKLTFKSILAGKERTIVITEISGGSSLYLMIDDYYFGQFSHTGNGWVFLPQNPSKFTAETVDMLLGKVREWQA